MHPSVTFVIYYRAKLVPPPEPPAMLLALDNQVADDGASSPDEGLVIDDQRDTYDPDQPNSPSSGNRSEYFLQVIFSIH